MNYKGFGRKCKGLIEVLSQHLPRGTEGTTKNLILYALLANIWTTYSLDYEFKFPATPVCLVLLLLRWGIDMYEGVVAIRGMEFMLYVCFKKETCTV